MFKNYLLTAYRNLLRFKLDSLLNISGLIIGLSAALLILLFVRYEYSFDRFWSDAERIYRIQTRWVMAGREDINIVTSAGPLKAALEEYFPNEIETVARLHVQNQKVHNGAQAFAEEITFADPEILDIFDFEMVGGDARLALADNASIILNETLARKFFGAADPLGKTLTIDLSYLKRDYRVAAVMRDLPPNTHLNAQALIKIDENDFVDNRGKWMFGSWNAANNHTYLKLNVGASIATLDSQMDDFTDATLTVSEGKASDRNKFVTIAVPDIHLHTVGDSSFKTGGDGDIVLAFAIIAVLIVAVATINYVNLTTARAGQRAKEMAMRKVMGANRGQLLLQQLGESLLIVTLSAVLAVLCVESVLPYFNHSLGLGLALDLADPLTLAGLLLAVLSIGLLSGIYPATRLAAFPPSRTLHASAAGKDSHASRARNALVVFQMTVTVALLVATAVVYAQLNHFRWLERGFDPEHLLAVQGLSHGSNIDHRDTFRDEVSRLPGVASVALSYEAPTRFFENNDRLWSPGEHEEQSHSVGATYVDYGYLDTLRIPLLAGRFYRPEIALDEYPRPSTLTDGEIKHSNVVINERAVKALNLGTPQKALGQMFEQRFEFDDDRAGKIQLTVIGVIGNTNLHTAKKPVRPEIYKQGPSFHFLLVRMDGDQPQTLAAIEAAWKRMMPEAPFEYFYIEQALKSEFLSETNQANVFLSFAILTMIIGCLGLYGLAAFVTESRRREIGIRKVLGASIADVLALLFGQFGKLVLIASLIAWPTAYLLMTDWLEQYPFRIGNTWVVIFCAAAALLATTIVAITVGSQALGAARSNPIEAIRHE